MREKQSVREGVWHIASKKRRYRKQRGRGIPFGLIVFAAAPLLGEVAKPLLKNFFGGRHRRGQQ